MEFQILVLLHVILAILIIGPAWVGSFFIMPWALRTGDTSIVAGYFRPFYKTSHILLTLQFLIGFRLGMIYLPIGDWFSFSSSISLSVVLKLALWILFFGWMIAGKRRGFTDAEKVNLPSAQQFFIILSILGVALVVTGLNFRLGLF
jgi:uncharacterized membrane protein